MELWILTFVLIMIRTSTFLAAMPLFGIRTLPKTVLVGLSLCLSYMWYANLTQPPEHLTHYAAGYFEWFGFFMAGFRESLVGLLLGTAFGLLLYPLQTAGSYLSQEMSMTNANLTDPSTQTNSNVMSVLFQTLGLLMIFTLGLYRFVFQVLDHSFERLPIGRPLMLDANQLMVDLLGQTEHLGLSIIAPAVISLFVVLIVLVLLNKASPQMNAFSIGMSVRVFAGLFFAFVFMPNLLNTALQSMYCSQDWIMEFLDSL